MKTTLPIILPCAFLLVMLEQCRDNSKHMTYKQAMRFRENYKSADSSTVGQLFGEYAAQYHNDSKRMLASVAFSKDELKELGPFFMGTVPKFSTVEPPQDQFDGYRIHVGIDTSWGEPTEVYILTFGDIKSFDKKKKLTHPNIYLQDKLNLGIYRFKNIRLNFDEFPYKKIFHKKTLTHLSCYPNCEGDELK